MKFATRFVPPESPAINFVQPSMADKSQQADCDVNQIMARYRETGFLVDPMHPGTRQPIFGDFAELPDYQGMLELIHKADADFALLPSDIRDKFENNPQKLFDFLNKEENFEEAVALGLCNPRPPKAEEKKAEEKKAEEKKVDEKKVDEKN